MSLMNSLLLVFGQFSDTTALWTILDRDLPKLSDIGRTWTDFILKLAPLLGTLCQMIDTNQQTAIPIC